MDPELDGYLAELQREGGTNMLLVAGLPAMGRVNGDLRPLPGPVLVPADVERLTSSLLRPDQEESLRSLREIDFSFSWRELSRVRANAFHQRGTLAVSLRPVPFEAPTFDQLGVPAAARALVQRRQGLILVTGPSGSGKSTTLAAMVDWLSRNRRLHIITVEDPIEYVHHHHLSAVVQREVGEDTVSFGQALRSALREDPDVLLVGEMRDVESIQAAVTFAETGHLVLATLHTNDAAQSIERVIDVFPAERQQLVRIQLASTLAGVIAQRLVPRAAGGVVAAFEVLVGTVAVANLVREGRTNQIRNSIVTGRREGMQTLEASLADLVAAGVITAEVALAQALHPRDLDRSAEPTP